MNTESALLCDSCSKDPIFETTKAYYVVQSYAAAIAQGLRANIWYSASGWRNSGLLNSDLSPRPAFTALKFARNELKDATWLRNVDEYTGVKGYEFKRDGRLIWVLWSLDGKTHLITLSEVPLAIYHEEGTPIPTVGSLNIKLEPLYLEWSL
jgi:hypothetical protein